MIRQALPEDRRALNNLIHFESYVHRHLDWRPILDWIPHQPFLVLEEHGKIMAALACPPDSPEVPWVRLFANGSTMPLRTTWERLWEHTREQLTQAGEACVGAVGLSDWFIRLITDSKFHFSHHVIVLAWHHQSPPPLPKDTGGIIRPTQPKDLPVLLAIDTAAFEPLWRLSATSLEHVYRQCLSSTVYENESGVWAYQITSPNPMGGHLARLAVHPQAQHQGIGYQIVRHLVTQLSEQGALQITVNTQSTNQASLALYEKAGFKRTGELYPIYEYRLIN